MSPFVAAVVYGVFIRFNRRVAVCLLLTIPFSYAASSGPVAYVTGRFTEFGSTYIAYGAVYEPLYLASQWSRNNAVKRCLRWYTLEWYLVGQEVQKMTRCAPRGLEAVRR